MAGVERIYFPGEIEQVTEEERLKTGIPFVKDEIDAMNQEAALVGTQQLRVCGELTGPRDLEPSGLKPW